MMQLMRRGALALLLMLPAISGCAGRTQPLEPLLVGREQLLGLEWEVASRGGRPVVSGMVTNDSDYTVKGVHLLVEALDSSAAVQAQEVTEVAKLMTPATRITFEARAQGTPSSTYRVRVFAIDLIENCGD
jgi:hypothetical protein